MDMNKNEFGELFSTFVADIKEYQVQVENAIYMGVAI
jgi:hypothetical protein